MVTPSGPSMNTNFREWKSMISFLVLNPFALSLATSASMFSTAKQMWFIPTLYRSRMCGSGSGSGCR